MEFYPVCKVSEGFLSVLPHPAKEGNLEENIASMKEKGVDVLISFLKYEESYELGLKDQEKHCTNHQVLFLNFPVEDGELPEDKEYAEEFLKDMTSLLKRGKHLALHCKGGRGRTGTFAGALMKISGMDPESIFTTLSEARGAQMPSTDQQKEWALQW